jgi:hypothetical protein
MVISKQDALALVSHHRKQIANQIGIWAAGSSSVLKVISGDFRQGRASIGMDGLMLRNRGNAFEVIPFDQILSIHPLQSERHRPQRAGQRKTRLDLGGTERACKIAPLRAAHDSGLRLGSPSKTRPPCHPRYGRSFFCPMGTRANEKGHLG